MPPEERDKAYLWDMLDAAQYLSSMSIAARFPNEAS